MTKTIVVPLDSSPSAEAALPVAEVLARRVDGRLLLLSVIEAPSEFAVWLRAEETIDAWAEHNADVATYLTGVAAGISSVPVETLVTTGNPAPEIADTARRQTDPLIVMVSHARRGLERLAIGNVAAAVLHNVDCPVIVVRQDDEDLDEPHGGPIDRLLVALDGSEFAERALSAAQSLLGNSGLTIHLLQVIETSKWYGMTLADLEYGALNVYVEAATEAASAYLGKTAARLHEAGQSVTWQVTKGLVADQINEVAREQNAGLIVMSTHGRTGLGRVFMGSVAERVVKDADRPVLLVHPGSSD